MKVIYCSKGCTFTGNPCAKTQKAQTSEKNIMFYVKIVKRTNLLYLPCAFLHFLLSPWGSPGQGSWELAGKGRGSLAKKAKEAGKKTKNRGSLNKILKNDQKTSKLQNYPTKPSNVDIKKVKNAELPNKNNYC